MKEDYVSLEVAKLLKEKCFNEYCEGYYYLGGYLEITSYKNFKNSLNKYKIAAPTLYIAQKWLREKMDIHITIDHNTSGYHFILYKTNGTFIKGSIYSGSNDCEVWNTYEEALSNAIFEALKII